MHPDYLEKVLNAQVYDIAVETPLELAANLSSRAGNKILLHYYAALGENTFYQFTGGSFTSSSTYPYSVKLYETSYDGIPAISVVVSSNSFASIGGLPQTADFLLQEFVHYA